ncbi:MAG: hypothetical protein LC104_03345 [Bacteroidales bacterium]|nr:hypothetical protein [Bacteroidales bacterium]
MRWFVRGDIDGFFGLAIDNLIQLLLIAGLCLGVLGFPPALLLDHVLPAVAVSLLVGNLFYAWQAKRLADQTGRTDVCALPYGINTVSLIAHVFLVMLPAKGLALQQGLSPESAARVAWHAGLVACVGSGVIEFCGAFGAQWIRRVAPRAALLATLSGIALGFISMSFVFRTFAFPMIGIVTFGIIMLTYFGNVRFKGGLPGGLVAVAVGTALAWSMGIAPVVGVEPTVPSWHGPVPVFDDLIAAFSGHYAATYLSVIIPMGIFNLLGSLQNIESAEAAGDAYPTAPSLAVNGLGTLAAAAFGSCFPTTIYIGHPGWKAMGARAGYSVLNGIFFTVICLFGLLATIQWAIPIEAGMAIVLYIGIVIAAQAFQTTPTSHAPAVVIGVIPGVAAWGTLMATQALGVAGYGKNRPVTEETVQSFQGFDNWINGAFALTEGFVLSSMILAATTVMIIERKFRVGAIWCLAAGLFSVLGLMHSYRIEGNQSTMALFVPAWPWAIGYVLFGLLLFVTPWITEPDMEKEDTHHP